jgi:vacuolar-type H+-ATPase subunit H
MTLFKCLFPIHPQNLCSTGRRFPIRRYSNVEQKTLETARNFNDLQTYNGCGIMEKVWDELKKIEAQAEQIQNDAQDRAKKMALLAKQDALKLVENSIIYAEEESRRLYAKAIEEANQERDEHLKSNQEAAEKLKAKAEKRMDKAVSAVVNAVLEDN